MVRPDGWVGTITEVGDESFNVLNRHLKLILFVGEEVKSE